MERNVYESALRVVNQIREQDGEPRIERLPPGTPAAATACPVQRALDYIPRFVGRHPVYRVDYGTPSASFDGPITGKVYDMTGALIVESPAIGDFARAFDNEAGKLRRWGPQIDPATLVPDYADRVPLPSPPVEEVVRE